MGNPIPLAEVQKRLQEKYNNLIILDVSTYTKTNSKARFLNKDTGNEWWAQVNSVLQGHINGRHGSNKLNLKDKQFGFLIANFLTDRRNASGNLIWECRCICGRIVYVSTNDLRSGGTKSCGCRGLGYVTINDSLVGKIFGYLTVCSFVGMDERTNRLWKCVCICGKETVRPTTLLTQGNTGSCGCEGRGIKDQEGWSSEKNITKRNFYSVWSAMKARCLNPLHKEYHNYGGRGIIVCDRWLDFLNFRNDMWESYLQMLSCGEKPTIERLNVNGNYEPSNVRWDTTKAQGKNKRDSTRSINYPVHKVWKLRLAESLRNILIKGYKTNRYLEYFGETISELKKHIESQFKDGMIWNNFGKGIGKWNFDHIIPCRKFDLAIDEDRYRCFNISNIQPLWWKDNIKKGGF